MGGEGELIQPYTDAMDIDTHVEQEIPPMGANTSSLPPLEFPPNIPALEASNLSGLEPPSLDSTGGVVTGADTPKHRIENKRRRKATLANQALKSQWTIYQGEFGLPVPPIPLEMNRGDVPIWLGSPSLRGRPPQGMGFLQVPYQHRNTMDARTDAQAAVDRGPH